MLRIIINAIKNFFIGSNIPEPDQRQPEQRPQTRVNPHRHRGHNVAQVVPDNSDEVLTGSQRAALINGIYEDVISASASDVQRRYEESQEGRKTIVNSSECDANKTLVGSDRMKDHLAMQMYKKRILKEQDEVKENEIWR